MNKQPITKQHLEDNPKYKLTEIFLSIQGEGPLTGEPCVFIRLAGCNLQCTWCDTDYSTNYEFTTFEIMAAIMKLIIGKNIKTVVITGGEPFVQNIASLVNSLHYEGYKIQIETNGMLSIPDFPFHKVMLVCSPKAGRIHKDIELHCQHFKYVVNTDDMVLSKDGLPAQPTQLTGARIPPRPKCIINKTFWVMPQDDEVGLNVNAAVDLALRYGHRLSLRIHKILGVR